jgi:hypothetical protein
LSVATTEDKVADVGRELEDGLIECFTKRKVGERDGEMIDKLVKTVP